jgi:hypothetical protein
MELRQPRGGKQPTAGDPTGALPSFLDRGDAWFWWCSVLMVRVSRGAWFRWCVVLVVQRSDGACFSWCVVPMVRVSRGAWFRWCFTFPRSSSSARPMTLRFVMKKQ